MERRGRAKPKRCEGSRVWACVHGGGPPVLFCLNSGAARGNPTNLLFIVLTVDHILGCIRQFNREFTCSRDARVNWDGNCYGPRHSVGSLSALVWWSSGGLFLTAVGLRLTGAHVVVVTICLLRGAESLASVRHWSHLAPSVQKKNKYEPTLFCRKGQELITHSFFLYDN